MAGKDYDDELNNWGSAPAPVSSAAPAAGSTYTPTKAPKLSTQPGQPVGLAAPPAGTPSTPYNNGGTGPTLHNGAAPGAAPTLQNGQTPRAPSQFMAGTSAPAQPTNGAGTQYADFLTGSGPTQTGYLNFDSYAAANGQASRNAAQNLNNQTANAAKSAKQGVYDVNDTFQNELNAGSPSDSGPMGRTQFSYQQAKDTPTSLTSKPRGSSGAGAGTTTTTQQADTAAPASPATPNTAAPAAASPTAWGATKAATPVTGPGSGGAAGPVYSPTPPPTSAAPTTPTTPTAATTTTQQADTAAPVAPTFAPTLATVPGPGPTASTDDPYADYLAQNAAQTYTGPNGLSDDSRYNQVGTDVRNAQAGLDATQTAGGIGTAAGGNAFDGELLNQQGQQAFAQTRGNYGDLNKFASDTDAADSQEAQSHQLAAQNRSGAYQGALDQYNSAKTDAAATAAAKAASKSPLPTFDPTKTYGPNNVTAQAAWNNDNSNGNLGKWGLSSNSLADKQTYSDLLNWESGGYQKSSTSDQTQTNEELWDSLNDSGKKSLVAAIKTWENDPSRTGSVFPASPDGNGGWVVPKATTT